MKLTYWKADCTRDSDVYSIRAKTRKECLRLALADGGAPHYSEPKKVIIHYADAFALAQELRSEGCGDY